MAINKVLLVGRLVADPETRYTESGIAVSNFRVAVERNFKNKNGEKVTDFINCVAWNKLGEIVCQYCKKGKQVAVDGSLQQKQWEKEGVKHNTYEVNAENVQFLDGASDDSSGNNHSQDNNHSNNSNSDPDLPF